MKDFLRDITVRAGALSQEYFDKGVTHETKSAISDLVTEADIAVSDFLVKKISEQYPDHQITSEERDQSINPGAEWEWVIDPIDGTRNFAMGVPLWAILVTVVYRGETFYAAAYNPVAGEMFMAEKGKGATMNDMPIKVGDKKSLEHSAGSFGRFYEV